MRTPAFPSVLLDASSARLPGQLKIYGVRPPLARVTAIFDDSAALTTRSRDRRASGRTGREHQAKRVKRKLEAYVRRAGILQLDIVKKEINR